MTILFDIGHPAHVHLFKNFISYLKKSGHTVVVASREKDITGSLLDHYRIPHVPLSAPGRGLFGMLIEMIRRDVGVFRLHRKHHFDAAFGTSVSIGLLSFFAGVRSYCFNEDDDAVVPLFVWLSYPFVTKIINPICLHYSGFVKKRIFHRSFHKLAYLHPKRFKANKTVLKEYGLVPGKYIVARFSALKAHHDLGAQGLAADVWHKIEQLLTGYTIVMTRENDRKFQVHPAHMHDVLASAAMLISDSQSMSVEAALLGIPAIRYNSFIGKSSVLDELEKTYSLTLGFRPSEEKQMLEAIRTLLSDRKREATWRKRRARLLHDKIDLTQWMIDLFTQIKAGAI